MVIAFDTNVVLDALLQREHSNEAIELIKMVVDDRITGRISANTITDIFYTARKTMGEDNTKEAIWEILNVFDVAPIDGDVCIDALGTQMKDFEDAVLAVSANRCGTDFIVSRDKRFMEEMRSPVEVVSPSDAMQRLMRNGI